jgi:hypothetical protein
MNRSATSLVLGGLVFVIAACGGGNSRNGFDDDKQNTDPATTDGKGGGDNGSGGFGGTTSSGLALDPKNTTVIIDSATNPATPGTVTYKVLQKTSGGDKDITANAKFSLKDTSLGSLSGATFTSVPSLPAGTLGKSTIVMAQTDAGQALGTLTVVQLRKTGPQRDFFFVVPFQDDPTPKNDTLKFSTNIKQADVAFVMDTTGSMSGSIANLKNALQGTLLAQLQAAIPNVGLAVVDFKDFSDGASVLTLRQTITTNLTLVKNAVGQMIASGGGDGPEASIAGMQYALLGAANPPIPAHTPAPGTTGGVDFRAGSVPVIVHVHDNDWHDPSGNATMASLKAAFASTNAKFVNIADNSGPENKANELSDATNSNVPPAAFGSVAGCSPGQCCTGINGSGRAPTGPGGSCRLNFVSNNGSGVSAGIVKAIEAIAVGSSFDVTAKPSNDPKNAKGVDATKFIKALRAMDEGNQANGCPAAPAKDTNGDGIKDTFIQVKVGTPVCFEVIPQKNTTVEPDVDPQFFNAFIDVIGVQGNVNLDHRAVLFLVPPKDAGVK